MAAHDLALEITDLCKSFDKPAVDGISLSIPRGLFYVLLGPNGAGKTTLLRMVSGILPPDSGAVRICGVDALADPIEAKRRVAWVSDEPMVYDRLTPLEYLEFVAGLWSIPSDVAELRAHELLDWLSLSDNANKRCGSFSKGMLQKMALAGALIHEPDLIILDEPLTGLDAGAARQVKDVLFAKVRAGATIVMTTHILDVAERMAEKIGVIANGRVIAEGTLAELQSRAGKTGSSLEDVFLELVATPDAA